MTEILFTHDKIENREQISKEEQDAINSINNYFNKNKGTDKVIFNAIKEGNRDAIPDAQKEIAEDYNKIKDGLRDFDAYTPEEYNQQKNNVIKYLSSNFGHLYQDIKGLGFESLHPDVLEAKLYNYNLGPGKERNVNIPYFMTNFNAEYIQKGIAFKEQEVRPPKVEEYNKDQEHIIGKIFEVPASEKAYIKKLIGYIKNGESFELDVFGQSDGTPVRNPEFIGKKYNTLRTELLTGCSPDIQKNIESIFPVFNNNNYPDKDAWNIAFAKTRALAKLSHLSPDDKNTIFAGDFREVADKTYKIGNTTFRFNSVPETGNEHTLGRVSLKPSMEFRKQIVTEYIENYLQNINSINTRFHIIYPQGTNLGYDKTPDYDPEFSNKVRSGQSRTARFSSDGFNANFMINNSSDWKSPQKTNLFKGETHVAIPDKLQPQSHGTNLMNILITSDDIVAGKYDNIFTYKVVKDPGTQKDVARYVQLKDGMSFAKALGIFKDVNKDDPKAVQYADNVTATLNNFDKLADQLKNDDALRLGVSKDMFSKREKSSGTKLGNLDSAMGNAYYRFLIQLGASVTQANTTDGRTLLSFSMKDKNGVDQKIGSKLFS